MAMTQDSVKALDQLRQRLSQLSTSIAALRADLERIEPLPTWPSLQSSAQALSFNLQQLGETFNQHRQLFKEAHAYPLSSFPGPAQEGLLEQLLRKKLEPRTEDWVEEYTVKFDEQGGGFSKDEMRELWSWAAPTSASIVRPMLEEDGSFDDDFTIAEREAGVENVVTGLKRKLDEEEEDEEDEEVDEDGMDDITPSTSKDTTAHDDPGVDPTQPALPIETALKYASTGNIRPKR